MRIGFDMLAVQSPHHGHRGIGRYSAHLVSTLLGRDDAHEYVFYVYDGLPDHRVPLSPRAEVRRLACDPGSTPRLMPVLDGIARTNPDRLDVLVVLSPFEKWAYYTPPARQPGGLPIASVVYDLIPFLFQNELAVDPELVRHYRTLQELTRYDVLLAISEATRTDCLSVLDHPPERVVNISGASDPSAFQPAAQREPWDDATRAILRRLGVDRPFIFNVGGLDPRKNTWTLIDAFARLPRPLRSKNQLVLTFSLDEWGRLQIEDYVRDRGLDRDVVVTGEVSDTDLKVLYQHCQVFVFPSTYEGFGLPILEAMHCGAPIVAGNNSSQIEVVGDAGLLAEASDPADIAAKLNRVLADPALASRMSEGSIEQARRFGWDRTADRALAALSDVVQRAESPRGERRPRARSRKPTIAVFSPFPPRKSGISDYTSWLLDELRRSYRIDLYHDAGYVPEKVFGASDFRACDHRLFGRISPARDYHGIVYQMGNSHYHAYMYETMMSHPGVVTLHDFCLAGFHLYYGHSRGRGYTFLRETLLDWYGEDRDEIVRAFDRWPADWEEIARDCSRRGWYANRQILAAAEEVIVHSPWCKGRVEAMTPERADRVTVIPHGANARSFTPEQRASVRQSFDIPPEALVVASFGFVHRDKMTHQSLDAFAAAKSAAPGPLLFLFVGEDADAGRAQAHAASLGLGDSVRFLGRQPTGAFLDLMSVTDVGINLRMPPTNGETSGALLALLSAGVPTIVTDVATFSDYPPDVVRKVAWENDGQAGLNLAVRQLIQDQHARARLAQAACEHVEQHHAWPKVAAQYAEVIEACRERRERRANRSGNRSGLTVPSLCS